VSENYARIEALDFVVNVLREQERRMDEIVEELSCLSASLNKNLSMLEKEVKLIQDKESWGQQEVIIDGALLREAQETGLNISEICENALKEKINRPK